MPSPEPSPTLLRRRLLAWYDASRRELAFRGSRDPYAIWVSEIMLQQTTVAAVVPYWERFVSRFPDLAALARADVDEVLALWAGLGYYRRARMLHQAARVIVEEHGGALPRTSAELARLPGIGPYTAAAVASIAFGEAVPAIDGNVLRVLARLFAVEGPPRRQPARGRLEDHARRLIDSRRPGDFNQALMELGATVCRPAAPACGRCPLEKCCRARREGRTETLPSPAPRPATRAVHRAALLVGDPGGPVLVRRAPAGGHNAGLWELPWIDWPGAALPGGAVEPPLAGLRREFTWLVPALGRLEHLGRVRHSITRHRITVEVFAAGEAPGDLRLPAEDWRWIEIEDGAGLSAATRRALALR